MIDFVVILVVFLSAFAFINSFKNQLSAYHLRILRYLYLYHVFFGIFYCFFLISDPYGYWLHARELDDIQFYQYLFNETGTYFMFALHYLPANVMDLSYFTVTMMYTFLGMIGLVFFYVIAVTLVPQNTKYKGYYLFPLLFFMPNLHLWSVAAGKDTICFFCVAAVAYGLLKPGSRILLIALGLLLSYCVRPHIMLFIVLGFAIGYVFSQKTSVFRRLAFSVVFLALGLIILPTVMENSKIEEASIESFSEFSTSKSQLLSRENVGSKVDIGSYPYPVKVFTFLYRPLFFDINGIPSLLSSLDNLLLLLLSIKFLRNKPLESIKKSPPVIKGLFYFFLLGTLVFCQILGNLGIMIRMKNMFIPGLLIFFLWSFSYVRMKYKVLI